MKTIFILIFVVFGLILTLGCTTATGPLFREVLIEEHEGKAIVYFYRNSHAGSAATNDLRINEGNPLPLQNEGYYLFILDPGTYDFAVFYKSELKAENRFVLQENRTYYIRFWIDVVGYKSALTPLALLPGGYSSPPLIGYGITSVPRDEALEVLKKCRLIEER